MSEQSTTSRGAALPASRRGGAQGALAKLRSVLVRNAGALVVGTLITAIYSLYSWRQWARFQVPSWDQGIFTQLMRAYAEFRSPVVPIKGEDFMLLGDHFHPLLVIFAPFYAIWPSGLTLLIAQAVCVGISAAILTACAARHLGKAPGVMIGLAYGLSWGITSAVASQFHEVALALPLLAASLSALVDGKHRRAVLWALPLLGVKEDLGLTVAAIGLVIALRGSRRLGAATLVGGVAAFWLTTSVILPALNPDGVWDYAEDSILAQLLSEPGAALARLGEGANTKAALILLVIGVSAFLAVLSPITLIAAPTLAWRLTSDVPFHWSTDWHYSAVLMVVVFAAAIDVLHRRERRYTRPFAVLMLIAALALTPAFALRSLADPQTYRPAPGHEGAQQVLNTIEDDAVVISDITMLAYLAPRTQVYWLASPGAPTPDYVVINQRSGVHRGNPPQDIAEYATERFGDHGWQEVVNNDGFLVAERDR